MHLLVLEYLQGLASSKVNNHEKIDQALSLLKDALYVDVHSGEDFDNLSYFPLSLADFVNAGKDKLKLTHPSTLLQEVQGDADYTTFEDVLSGKGYFNGVEEGSVAYKQRKLKSISKYLERKVSRCALSNYPPVNNSQTNYTTLHPHAPQAVARGGGGGEEDPGQ